MIIENNQRLDELLRYVIFGSIMGAKRISWNVRWNVYWNL